jgi:uncharacterized protein (DUF1697 family)
VTTYVALLRGIGPGNPNMTSAKLTDFLESLVFKQVATVITSGNVVFNSPSKDIDKLKAKIENNSHLEDGRSDIRKDGQKAHMRFSLSVSM